MPNSVTPIQTTQVDDWSLAFSHMNDFDGSPLGVLVELTKDGKMRTRLSASTGKSEEATMSRLLDRAKEWIDEYEQRPHTGDTSFGAL